MKGYNLMNHSETTKLLSDKKVVIIFISFVVLIIYLLYGTGIVSDDFAFIRDTHDHKSFLESVIYGNHYISRPVFKYIFSIYYYFVDINNYVLIDFLKILLVILIFYMTTKFFSIFLNKESSMIVSFLFIFFPTHDSTAFFYLEIALSLCIGLYLYAYYLVYNNRFILAGILSFLASFVSYGSPPIAFVLFVLCLLNKAYKKGLTLFIPVVIYSTYFIIETIGQRLGIFYRSDVFHTRLPSDMNLSSVIKQFILQIITFIDAILGPSFFMKIYYSILQNNGFSIMLAVIFIVVYLLTSRIEKKETKNNKKETKNNNIDRRLLITLIVLTIGSLGMFALTGLYPQMAFNLGNRVTIYGSLLVAYLIVTVPIPENIRRGIILIFFAAIVGISVHWKQWNQHQMYVIDNISTNKELASYDGTAPIYVSGNQYSKMGPYSHIEFLSEHWVVDSIFKLAGHEKLSARSLNKRSVYENGVIIDKKYNSEYSVGDTVMVYDSEADQLLEISAQNLNNYINKLPDDKRHWIQFIKNEYINALILKLMPRLRYVL